MDLPINEESQEFQDEGFQDGYHIAAYLETHPRECDCTKDCSECINWAIQIVTEQLAELREAHPSV